MRVRNLLSSSIEVIILQYNLTLPTHHLHFQVSQLLLLSTAELREVCLVVIDLFLFSYNRKQGRLSFATVSQERTCNISRLLTPAYRTMWSATKTYSPAALRQSRRTLVSSGTAAFRPRVVLHVRTAAETPSVDTAPQLLLRRRRWRDDDASCALNLPDRQRACLSTAAVHPAWSQDVYHSLVVRTGGVTTTSCSSSSNRPAVENREVRVLFETLRSSQQLVLDRNAAAAKEKETVHWIPFFANLGSSTCAAAVVDEEDEETVVEAEKGDEDENDDDTKESSKQSKPQHLPKPASEKSPAEQKFIEQRKQRKRVTHLQCEIYKAYKRNKPLKSMVFLRTAMAEGIAQDLNPSVVRALLLRLNRHPLEAHDVLRFYQTLLQSSAAFPDKTMYRFVCEQISFLDPRRHDPRHIFDMVHAVVKDLQQMDQSAKETCFPVLLSSLAKQKAVGLGSLTRNVYTYMCEELTVPDGLWEHLLSLSRYYRQDDLPFAEILEKVVASGRRPHPPLVANAIGNLFPYHDTGSTFRMLQAIIQLQRTSGPDDIPYQLDISTLELIGSAAAAKGFYDMNLAVWDLLDLLQYEPTEAIYENTILAFCARPPTYGNAFAVLADMEEKGMFASRALLRGMSTLLRYVMHSLCDFCFVVFCSGRCGSQLTHKRFLQ